MQRQPSDASSTLTDALDEGAGAAQTQRIFRQEHEFVRDDDADAENARRWETRMARRYYGRAAQGVRDLRSVAVARGRRRIKMADRCRGDERQGRAIDCAARGCASRGRPADRSSCPSSTSSRAEKARARQVPRLPELREKIKGRKRSRSRSRADRRPPRPQEEEEEGKEQGARHPGSRHRRSWTL